MSTSSAPTRARRGGPFTKYVMWYLVATIGSVWAMTLFYVANYPFAVSVLGELQLTNPLVVIILHMPVIAAFCIVLHYDGLRGVLNFLKTLIPRPQDWLWLVVLMLLMLGYILSVRFVCTLVGIEVPPDPAAPLEMLVTWLRLFIMEIGMIAIALGWFGFFMPMMHRITDSHVLSGIATGLGIAIFVAPGNLFSSFELATAWPVYATQLCVLSIGMSYLISKMKGNVLFFLLPFWVSAGGSQMRLYYFAAQTQLVQLTLFSVFVVALVLVLRGISGGQLDEPYLFPEYMEREYTVRKRAVIPGDGDRSHELLSAYAGRVGDPVVTGQGEAT